MKRRKFLGKTALGTAAMVGFPSIVPANVLGKNAPSNKINIGQIGCGRIARSHDLIDTRALTQTPTTFGFCYLNPQHLGFAY